jgi:hypothetical protein
MKKTTYLAPETTITEIEVSKLMSSSITKVGGDAGIERGNDEEAPTEANSRRRYRNDWEDEEYDEEENL